MAQHKPRMNPPPVDFMQCTTPEHTVAYVRKIQVAAYGEAPEGYEGNAWYRLSGTEQRVYVLESMDDLTVMLQ